MTLRDRKVLEEVETEQGPPGPPRRRSFLTAYGPPTPVCAAIFVLCVLVYLADLALAPSANVGPLARQGLLFGPFVTSGQWWRTLTTVFVHGGLLHIGFNMMVVISIGFVFERAIGPWRMLVISIVGALGASAFALHFNYAVPTVGASGMILGWVGAMLPIANRRFRSNLWVWLIEIAVISILPGVSWAAHLGGFLAGLPCGFALREGKRFWWIAPFLVIGAAMLVYAAGSHPPPSVGPAFQM
jgi:membrane associated rhomboid family serine protease